MFSHDLDIFTFTLSKYVCGPGLAAGRLRRGRGLAGRGMSGPGRLCAYMYIYLLHGITKCIVCIYIRSDALLAGCGLAKCTWQ